MTDYLLRYADDGRREANIIECQAYTEEEMRTCPCGSCRSYQRSREADEVYEARYAAEMEKVKQLAQDAYYRSDEYLLSNQKCTCGSGGHPRRCNLHPEAYEQHIKELESE